MKSKALEALTAAALTLPALVAQAEDTENKYQIGIKIHSYDEGTLSAEQVLGSQSRYDIDANQFQLSAKLSDSLSAALDLQTETMSGASPWYTIKNGDGEVVQVMSGASIKDKRRDVSANISYQGKSTLLKTFVAHSDEDDYESLSLGASVSFDFDNKLSTWTLAGDFSNDDIMPVDTDLYSTRPIEGSKHSSSLLVSYSRILNKSLMMQVSAGYISKSGLLSDPYKVVFVDNSLLGDSRPNTRKATTIATQLRYYVQSANGALHADYRFYDDDWQVTSHTIDLAWYQNLPYDIQLVPSIRLYSQSDSYFYQVYYDQTRPDNFYSTDYRLSEYGAITLGLKIEKQFDDLLINLQAQEYSSGSDKVIASSDSDNPALLDFSLVSIGLSYRF